MSAKAILLCVVCELALVVGALAGGIGFEAIWFFLWIYLLARWDLSRLFPFEGLNPVLIAIGAVIFLKERLPIKAWIGIAMISVGIALVSMS
ncbi:MAG: hypothetical protein DMF59_00725 [Acidobacteria bacterium]|nr:MAG: hypothetical protein DMF59_00725 [Acidobacteriota bacterium]